MNWWWVNLTVLDQVVKLKMQPWGVIGFVSGFSNLAARKSLSSFLTLVDAALLPPAGSAPISCSFALEQLFDLGCC